MRTLFISTLAALAVLVPAVSAAAGTQSSTLFIRSAAHCSRPSPS